LHTPFKQGLANPDSARDFFGASYGQEVFVEKLPESLMIALTQFKTRGYQVTENRRAILERALWQYAENGKYSNDLVEHLLASPHAGLVLKYSEKFSEKIAEKVIRSGGWDITEILEFLLKNNIPPPDEFDRYADCFVRNNYVHGITSGNGKYTPHDLKTSVKLPYQSVIKERKIIDITPDGVQRDAQIESIIQRGYVSFLLNENVFSVPLTEYVSRHYESFHQMITVNNQEHLVLSSLRDPDKHAYIHKLIERGEEYKVVRILNLLPEDFTLGKEIFDSLKKKNFALNLGERLECFRGLDDSDALTYIENNQIQLFLDQFASFSLTEEFLQRTDIHDLCLEEFNSMILSRSTHGLNKAKKLVEDIPIPQEKIDAILMKVIRSCLGEKPQWHSPHELVEMFPHLRSFLGTEEFQSLAKTEIMNAEHLFDFCKVLETIPLPDTVLKGRDILERVMNALRKSILKVNEKDSFDILYRICDEIVRIARFVPLPLDPQRIRAAIEVIEKLPQSIMIRQEYSRRICVSEDPENALKKMLDLQVEFENNKSIASNEKFLLLYVSQFFSGGTQEEKEAFAGRIMKDISLLSKNQPISSENKEYYEGLLKEVYPQRNYNTYEYLDQYEDRSQDLAAYKFEKNGYDFHLSGVLGYRIKADTIPDAVLIKEFSDRIASIKSIATEESLSMYLSDEVPDSQAKTLEGKILDYFKAKGYTVDTMNVLLAYQLLGSYDSFVASSIDRVNLEENEVSKNYILLDELVNQYGDNMKETIKAIQERVAQSEDRALFSETFQEKYEKKYADALLTITKDLAKIPRDKLTTPLIQKKIAKTLTNVFQGLPEIQKSAGDFALLFSVNDFDTFEDVWQKHIDQFFTVDAGGRIDTVKVEKLQSSVYIRLQNEIGKYEEIKEVDTARNQEKLSKDRLIKGYFSKNRENAHARMVADICLAADPNMLKNNKYFEFVLFDEERERCVGTTMLLEMNEPEEGKKYLLYCPNPSVGLVSEVSAKRFYQMLTKQAVQFANENGFDALLVDKRHGHSTNRAGLFQQSLEQSCLKDPAGKERSISLKNSHTLSGGYTYQKNLQLVWER